MGVCKSCVAGFGAGAILSLFGEGVDGDVKDVFSADRDFCKPFDVLVDDVGIEVECIGDDLLAQVTDTHAWFGLRSWSPWLL